MRAPPEVLGILGACVDFRQAGPSLGPRLRCLRELQLEPWLLTAGGEERVHLRPAFSGVPGVGVDLGEAPDLSEIEQETAALRSRPEKEIPAGLIFTGG